MCEKNMLKYMNKFIFLFFCLVSASGFAVSDEAENLIYQKSTNLDAALKYVNTPDNKIKHLKHLIKGVLADQHLLRFANKIITARETHNETLILSLVNQESLTKPNKELDRIKGTIKDGSMIYGNKDFRYFVTKAPITAKDSEDLKFYFKKNITKPSLILYFYHFHPSNGMLIASAVFLTKAENGYKIILPIR